MNNVLEIIIGAFLLLFAGAAVQSIRYDKKRAEFEKDLTKKVDDAKQEISNKPLGDLVTWFNNRRKGK
jgi:hypothetical protein